MLHAELERIANHLDVAVRLADAAGLAVATARFALHKERVLRLVSRMCGSRFGRGVVVPGGVSALPRLSPAEIIAELGRLGKPIAADAAALMATSSFLDRLRGTGPLTPERARQHGALGPIGKAAGFADDARLTRPYDAYPWLAVPPARAHPPVTRWPGCGCGGRKWTSRSACSGGPPKILAERPPVCPGSPASRPWPRGRLGRGPAGRGPLRRDPGAAGSSAATPGRRRSTTWC